MKKLSQILTNSHKLSKTAIVLIGFLTIIASSCKKNVTDEIIPDPVSLDIIQEC